MLLASRRSVNVTWPVRVVVVFQWLPSSERDARFSRASSSLSEAN